MKRSSHRKTYEPYTLKAYVAAQPANMTLKDIARDMGLWPSQMTHFLQRQKSPSKHTALRLHEQYGLDLKALLTLDRPE